jgi:hypothetical protein
MHMRSWLALTFPIVAAASGCGRLGFAPIDDAQNSVIDAKVLPAGLILYLPMDSYNAGCGVPMEPSTIGRNCSGDPTVVDGQVGNGYQMFGHPIELQSNDLLPASQFTISFWVAIVDTPRFQAVISQSISDSSTNNVFSLGIRADNTMFLGFAHGASVPDAIELGQATSPSWRHFCFVFNAGAITAYINGGQRGSYSGPVNFSKRHLIIGADQDLGIVNNTFLGALDEVRVYNRRLSEPEIVVLASEAR